MHPLYVSHACTVSTASVLTVHALARHLFCSLFIYHPCLGSYVIAFLQISFICLHMHTPDCRKNISNFTWGQAKTMNGPSLKVPTVQSTQILGCTLTFAALTNLHLILTSTLKAKLNPQHFSRSWEDWSKFLKTIVLHFMHPNSPTRTTNMKK